jgi:predicted P-loop ATPase
VTAVRQGITSAAAQRERNSVTRWLDALKWDGRARLGSWMTDYLGTPNDDYHCRIGRNWLISMVARAYQPGCQVDTVPVLQGAMGKGKSSAVAILGGEWFAALPENFGSVDFFQCIQGKWLIEIPDLAGFRGRDHTIIISAISRRVDTYRASYGHHPEDRPRRTVFAITTELSAEYLSEGRGRRRFWPIECSTIDCTALATDREQLFAEAMAAYRSGEKWWEVTDDIAERQDVLVSEHPWTRSVLAYCKGKEVLGVHAGDILELALSIRLQDQHDGQKGIVSKILSMDGWKQNNTSRKGERLRVWRKI